MANWIADREPVHTTNTVNPGYFGWAQNPLPSTDGKVYVDCWHSCRETFLQQQAGKRVIYFSHELPLGRGRSIAEFIEKIEIKLGIKSNRRTKVQATSKRRIVKIHVARFWDQSSLRRSLFTALLRASLAYRMSANNQTGNLEEAIDSISYLSETRRAVDRFINKRAVHYWGGEDIVGWWSIFRNRTNSEIGRMLRKNKKLKPKPRVIYVQVPAVA